MAQSIKSNTKHFDTIVIGAGVSGIACAARIFQHRARHQGSIAVLEARDRIGSRVGSVYVNGNRLDTGANWIHGIGTKDAPNPLMGVLPHKRYREISGAVTFRVSDEQLNNDGGASEPSTINGDWHHVSDSKRSIRPPGQSNTDLVIPADSASKLMDAVWGPIGSLHEEAVAAPSDKANTTTLLRATARSEPFRAAFENLPSTFHRTLKAWPQFMEVMEAAPLAAQSAERKESNPGVSLAEYAIDDFDGDQVYLQDGYTAVVEELAKDLVKAGCIELGVEVDQIHWSNESIAVHTSNGTYTAKDVICTLPMGVLKSRIGDRASSNNHKPYRLFSPELPKDKIDAIRSCGYGTLDKVFLVYNEPWWTKEPFVSIFKKGNTNKTLGPELSGENDGSEKEPDYFAGFTDELAGIELDPDGTTKSGARLLSMMNLHSLTGVPALSAFVSCANALHIESLSNEGAGDIVHRALTQWLGQEPPKADAVHVTRWARDPYSLGSYSFMITGLSEVRHREAFQHAIVNEHGAELRFAGEHTSRNHFATVHGALLSGWREADAILEKHT